MVLLAAVMALLPVSEKPSAVGFGSLLRAQCQPCKQQRQFHSSVRTGAARHRTQAVVFWSRISYLLPRVHTHASERRGSTHPTPAPPNPDPAPTG